MQADEELAATVREEVPGGHNEQMLSPVTCAYAPALNLCNVWVHNGVWSHVRVQEGERELARAWFHWDYKGVFARKVEKEGIDEKQRFETGRACRRLRRYSFMRGS